MNGPREYVAVPILITKNEWARLMAESPSLQYSITETIRRELGLPAEPYGLWKALQENGRGVYINVETIYVRSREIDAFANKVELAPVPPSASNAL